MLLVSRVLTTLACRSRTITTETVVCRYRWKMRYWIMWYLMEWGTDKASGSG